MKKIVLIALVLTGSMYAQSIEKFSIDSGGASVSAGNIQVLYTIGEVMVQERSAGNIQVSEGFVNPTSLKLTINPKVFLQGPFASPVDAGLMNDNLRQNNLIPTLSPYTDALTCDISVFTPTGDDAIVDWVLVELRDSADRSVVIESRSALLQRDGDIVDVDGVAPVNFSSPRGTYFLLVGHRNHLSILSATPVTVTSATVVDLSSDPIAVFGGNNAVNTMSNNTFAMFGGDLNTDGQILNGDLSSARPQLSLQGYLNADSDLDGQVLNQDISVIIRPNLSKGIQY